MNNEKNPEEILNSFQFTKSPHFRTLYANWIQGAYGPFDISVLIGETFASPNKTFEVEQTARIVFSPIEAKLLVMILTGVVHNFEEQYGQIKIPNGLDAAVTTTTKISDDLKASKAETK